MKEAFIVSAARTAVGKSKKGALAAADPEDLAALVIREIINRTPNLEDKEIEDVLLGCAIPEKAQGYNIARNSAVRAGLPYSVPGVTVNRFCSSGLQTIAMAAQVVLSNMGDSIVAGGVESMSKLPMDAQEIIPNTWLMENHPELFISMGMTAEKVAKKYSLSRDEQDKFSLGSHKKAVAAIDAGRFKEQIVAVPVTKTGYSGGKVQTESFLFDTDEGPRRDSSMEGLAKLKPVFMLNGTVTAGNSSQTSDGAAAVITMSGERVKEKGITPLARFAGFSVAGVDPSVMGLGPIEAIPKVLKQTGLSLREIGLIELNEAFAAQSLAVIRELNLNPEIVNVNGGAIALGHPLGCSGAKLVVQMIYEMRLRKVRYGLISLCIGGGMGAAAVIELV